MCKKKIPIVSLFSGSGGLDLGFEQAGFEVIVAYDNFEAAIQTYNYNRNSNVAKIGDIKSLTGETIFNNIVSREEKLERIGVIGGPPCQAFSQSNVYPRKNDIRRTLPGHFARILEELSAYFIIDFFLFENVRGLTYTRHTQEFARFRFMFETAGFDLFEAHLNAENFGVAQNRPRVFIVGINNDLDMTFKFPIEDTSQPSKTVREAFNEAFGTTSHPAPAFFRRNLSPEDIPFHRNHWTMMPKSKKFHDGTLKEGEVKGRSFRVLSWQKPSWTVAYGHREIHVHPSGKRRLSIFEAMSLQGFPPEYILLGNLSEQVKLVSDAVPPPLARHIAQAIQKQLIKEVSHDY